MANVFDESRVAQTDPSLMRQLNSQAGFGVLDDFGTDIIGRIDAIPGVSNMDPTNTGPWSLSGRNGMNGGRSNSFFNGRSGAENWGQGLSLANAGLGLADTINNWGVEKDQTQALTGYYNAKNDQLRSQIGLAESKNAAWTNRAAVTGNPGASPYAPPPPPSLAEQNIQV